MTFVQYARARRMELAMKHIRKGGPVIEAQLVSGYEPDSGFRDAFSRIMGSPPSKSEQQIVFKASWIDAPMGSPFQKLVWEALMQIPYAQTRSYA